jgi:hypothetical protein
MRLFIAPLIVVCFFSLRFFPPRTLNSSRQTWYTRYGKSIVGIVYDTPSLHIFS